MEANTIEAPAQEQENTDTLVVTDRCDKCGSQAYVGILFETGDLLLCAHHFNKYEAKILTTSVKVFDERWKLYPQRLDVSP